MGSGPTFTTGQPSGGGSSSALPLTVVSTGWSGPVPIDVSTATAQEANNDVSSSCTVLLNNGLASQSVRGCMQTPAVAATDNRLFVGYTTDYIPSSTLPFIQPQVTLFNALVSPVTHSFLGGLSVLDAGRGLNSWTGGSPFGPGPVWQISSRYVRYANFPNGNLIAVYYTEIPVAAMTNAPPSLFTAVSPLNYSYARVVYASIYDASRHQWGTPTQLSVTPVFGPMVSAPPSTLGGVDPNQTDFGVDFNDPMPAGANPSVGAFSNFCRPSVATAGDNSAMVAWCEQVKTTDANFPSIGYSQVAYARYSNGGWSTPIGGASPVHGQPLISNPTAAPAGARLAFPYYAGRTNNVGGGSGPNILQNDVFATGLLTGQGVAGIYQVVLAAQVSAATANPTPNQFLISSDSGNFHGCATLSNMITSLLSQPVAEYWYWTGGVIPTGLYPVSFLQASYGLTPQVPGSSFASKLGKTLSQLGISMRVDNVNCADGKPATWNLSTYYNRNLLPVFGDYTKAATTSAPLDLAYQHAPPTLQLTGLSAAMLPQLLSPSNGAATSLIPTTRIQEDWIRSASVDVAGDASGNYALVRSAVMPFLSDGDITNNGVGRARGLVGHEFLATTNSWIQRVNATGGNTNEPAATIISKNVSCQLPAGASGATGMPPGSYIPCSVRNPRILVADSGKGLVLFRQNQFQPPGAGSSTTPNRLWWATYSSATGYGSVAQPLDGDISCSPTSAYNDASECEASAFSDTVPTSGLAAPRCQVVGEPPVPVANNGQQLYQSLIHDVSPIAAYMNRAGQAVVAYTKAVQWGTSRTPSCVNPSSTVANATNYGIYVMIYDPVNGWTANAAPIDTGLPIAFAADGMHPAVYMTPKGAAAVVWEEISQAAPYTGGVFLKIWQNGSWGSAILVSGTDQTTPRDSFMPAVVITDNGEVVVTYTYSSSAGGVRRQYANHYYIPGM